jgi:hypothetical protein
MYKSDGARHHRTSNCKRALGRDIGARQRPLLLTSQGVVWLDVRCQDERDLCRLIIHDELAY